MPTPCVFFFQLLNAIILYIMMIENKVFGLELEEDKTRETSSSTSSTKKKETEKQKLVAAALQLLQRERLCSGVYRMVFNRWLQYPRACWWHWQLQSTSLLHQMFMQWVKKKVRDHRKQQQGQLTLEEEESSYLPWLMCFQSMTQALIFLQVLNTHH